MTITFISLVAINVGAFIILTISGLVIEMIDQQTKREKQERDNRVIK